MSGMFEANGTTGVPKSVPRLILDIDTLVIFTLSRN